MTLHQKTQMCVHLNPKVLWHLFSSSFKLTAKLAEVTCHLLFWAAGLKMVRQGTPPHFPVPAIIGAHHRHIRALPVVTLCQLQVRDGRHNSHSLFTEHTRLFPQSALALKVGVDHVAAKCAVATIRTVNLLVLAYLCQVFLNSAQFPFPIASHVKVRAIQFKA